MLIFIIVGCSVYKHCINNRQWNLRIWVQLLLLEMIKKCRTINLQLKIFCFAYEFHHAIDSKKANVSIWWHSPSASFNKSNIVISTINVYIENNNNLERKSAKKNSWLTKKPRKLIWWQTEEMYKCYMYMKNKPQKTLFYIDKNSCLKKNCNYTRAEKNDYQSARWD